MEVILKEDVKGVGKTGQVVKVSEGYARNFLFPGKKAVVANAGALKEIQEMAKRKEVKTGEEEQKLRAQAEKLASVEITIVKKAADDNKIFGSVTEAEIAEELRKKGFVVDKTEVILDGHIKELGSKAVTLKFKHDITAVIRVLITKEK
ncbi:MAG: 50S ribosomal protein L9 [Spirochaetia bacterium]|nr:50S ribosomal protein L9 [Spirochaetia bacterium]